MSTTKTRVFTAVLFAAVLTFSLITSGQESANKKRWYKGNLHTHTLNSDGDSTPHELATWYREHGEMSFAQAPRR